MRITFIIYVFYNRNHCATESVSGKWKAGYRGKGDRGKGGNLQASEVFAVGKYKCTHICTHRRRNCVTARSHIRILQPQVSFPRFYFLRPTLFTVELMVMRNICTQIIFQGLKLAFIRKLFFHMHAFTCTHTQKPTTSASLNKRQLEASPPSEATFSYLWRRG